MGIVDGSTNWNGQDNFVDFIQFHAEKLGMTREEYMAHYGSANSGINEDKKKPGPDPYHRGLEDDEVEDKEDQIKKQAKMDDDDPDAYKEMPGDKEAREKGEVKTSKATKAYNKIYGEDLDEGVMSNIHLMATDSKDWDDFLKKFKKDYKKVFQNTPAFMDWLYGMYKDMAPLKAGERVEESKVNEMAMGYDAHTGLFYFEGVPFTQERLEQSLKYLKTKLKLGKLPKQFDYYPALQVADNGGMEMVTLDLQDIKKIEDVLKRFKGKLAHDGDFDEEIIEANHSGNEASDKMAFSQLERIIDYATMLRDRMAAGKGLDAWMYGKVIKAEDYLNTLYDVIDGDDGVVETQKMTNKDWKKIKKFNKHITDSGEKFVMSYDDRIGTFLEPVEIVDENTVNEALKFGQKRQYSIDDINTEYGFWGTLEIHMDPESIEEIWHDVWGILTKSWKFSDAGALYYLNAKAGRHLADKVYNDINSQISQPDAIDMILSDYARPSRWKAWSKEYNEFAQEEMMQEAKRGDIHKAAKKGSYPATVVVINSGMVVKQEIVKTPAAVPAVFNELQAQYPDAIISVESKTGETLFSESVVNERLARGLKPLLKLGLTITKKAGEDALLDLSDKFDNIDDEQAEDVASHLNMAIELMQDGYPGNATKKLKQFNKACKDLLAGKEIGSAFESVVNEEDDKDQKSTDRGPLDDDKIETALKKKAQDTGVPIGIIRAVMRRGLAAWKSGHRPGANQQQWGYARVNAFLTKGEGTWGNADKDLAKEVRDGGHDKKLKKA